MGKPAYYGSSLNLLGRTAFFRDFNNHGKILGLSIFSILDMLDSGIGYNSGGEDAVFVGVLFLYRNNG